MIDFSKIKKYCLDKRIHPNIIYFLVYRKEIVYIGITSKLQHRVTAHIATPHVYGVKRIYKKFNKVYYLDYIKKKDVVLLEKCLIYYYKPKYNRPHFRETTIKIIKENSNQLINKYFK